MISDVRLPTEVLPVGIQICGSEALQRLMSSSFSDARTVAVLMYFERPVPVIILATNRPTETNAMQRTNVAISTSSKVNP